MRISAFLWGYKPYYYTGAILMSSTILEALAKRGHEVTVYTNNLEPHRTINGVNVVRRDKLPPEKQARPHLVYAHPGSGNAAPRYAYNSNAPLVGVVHNTQVTTDNEMSKFYNNYSMFVFNSEYTKKALIEYEGPVLHSPLKVNDYKAPRRGAKSITALSLSKAKGLDVFVELAQRMPEYNFLGVTGPYGAQEIPEGENITVLPNVDHSEIKSVFAQTKVFLAPSMAESWGRAAAEAMCSGIPVVASKAGGLVECLDGAGYNLDLDDIDLWESTVRELMTNRPLYTEQSGIARERAKTIERVSQDELEQTLDAMEALCRK